eukprot:GHVS01003794.1.p1 GENE.GHVS01003794.1~~GHVS01003794.1.p1  ORF type:complete len:642 (+),score=120.67 GHVS01003794.1:122-2047(+)
MIDAISIFTKGGVVLWSYYFIRYKNCPFTQLVQTVLLEERSSGGGPFEFGSSRLGWRLDNEQDLICVVAYPGIQPASYIETLLQLTQKTFKVHLSINGVCLQKDVVVGDDMFGNSLPLLSTNNNYKSHQHDKNNDNNMLSAAAAGKCGSSSSSSSHEQQLSGLFDNNNNIPSFDKKFMKILSRCDDMLRVVRVGGNNKKGGNKKQQQEEDENEEIIENIEHENYQDKFVVKDCYDKTNNKASNDKSSASAANKQQKPKKKDASWSSQKVTRRAMEALDFSKQSEGDEIGGEEDGDVTRYEGIDETDDDDVLLESDDDDEVEPKGLFARVASAVKDVTGNKELTSSELDKVLVDFKSSLMAKNVAVEIADLVTISVKSSLIGQTTQRFTSVKQTVKEAIVQAIHRIVTPKISVDILRSAMEAKAKGKVYSIAFLGVNGVGKSTNLAKVCYYLKHKGGLNVMIAACDTFRAGAVEQLRTHARCLGVHLFERGYGKDAAQIARQALAFAESESFDVVLIDTAGRMQDNEPLMKSLAKLVSLNNPDFILFVGEALVGNDAVDQVKKFNQALIDHSDRSCDGRVGGQPRGIDGILLTKFDTVDDKVGAALSMVYVTGQPIVFVGTGQKYTHLRKLNVGLVVKELTS